LTIDPAAPTPGVNTAHDFPLGSVHHDNLLHIRNITVKNGRIGQILGYKTADVSGEINLLGKDQTGPVVDRIAFFSLLGGASIKTPGDLNTLDIYNTISINTGPGIRIGRDLNWMYVGSDLNLQNGSSILIGRDLGLKQQGAKGTGFPGQGAQIRGNLIVGTGSTIAVGRFVDAPIIVEGSSSGISNLPPNVQSATVVFGTRG
jgi:hypothetical protein